MEYKDQIKSPKWQKKRLEILKRDEFTCQECGNKEQTLHIHHKHYNKGAKIWEYENWELTTLCEDCHSKTHNGIKKIELGKIETEIIELSRLMPSDKFNQFHRFLKSYCDNCNNQTTNFFPYLDYLVSYPGAFSRLNNYLSIIFNNELLLARIIEIENKLETEKS